MSRNLRVVVMGAGPAGLAAAWKLAEANCQVEVVEKEDVPGGLCRSLKRKGYIFDLGGHRFITKDEDINREVEDLMGDSLLLRPRQSVVRLYGKFYKYPLDAKDLAFNMNPLTSIRCFLGYLRAAVKKRSQTGPDLSFEDWVVNRFGKPLYEIYFKPYSEKLWGIPPSQVSSDWAAQRISLVNLWDVFLRLLGKKKDEPKTYATSFYYPKEGIGQISEEMARRIGEKGGRIHFRHRVKAVRMREGKIKTVVCEGEKGEREFAADVFVSTIPLPEFALSLTPPVGSEYREVAAKMRFRSLRFLHLFVDAEQVTPNTWIYIPEGKYPFFRVQEMRNWSPTTVPAGKTSLTLELACDEGDEIWQAKDEEIYRLCMSGFRELGLVSEEKVTGYFTSRASHAYPIYTLDYRGQVRKMYKLILGIENLVAIGRQGLYRYNNMDHSIKMGFLASEVITKDLAREKILAVASESRVFDWQDPGDAAREPCPKNDRKGEG